MKYRKLTLDELKELEQDFVRFLASNEITATEWEQLKQENSEKVDRLIEIYSDIVFEKVLSDVTYLEMRRPHDLRLFKFYENKVEMVGLLVEDNTAINFMHQQSPEEMTRMLQSGGGSLKIVSAEREYKKLREMEIFETMQLGALIRRDGQLFDTLRGMKPG